MNRHSNYQSESQRGENTFEELNPARSDYLENEVIDIQVVVTNKRLVEEVDLVGNQAEDSESSQEDPADAQLRHLSAKPNPQQDYSKRGNGIPEDHSSDECQVVKRYEAESEEQVESQFQRACAQQAPCYYSDEKTWDA